MKHKGSRKMDHNLGTHKERMAKRRASQRLRISTVGVRWTSKYSPLEEDRKHRKISEGSTLL